MAHKFKVGDKVTWNSHGGHAEGTIVKIATVDGSIKDFDYRASNDDPRYIIEVDDDKYAAHKEETLSKA